MELKCSWCKETKTETDFLKRIASEPYSQSNVRCCRECNAAKNRTRYKNPVVRNKQLAATKNWVSRNRDKVNAYGQVWISKHQANLKARSRVGYLIRHGYWKAQPCCICGATEGLEAHHDSYAKQHWDVVRWLCKDHHEAWHSIIDERKREITTAPLAEADELYRQHDEILREVRVMRERAKQLLVNADAISLEAWSEVQQYADARFASFVT